MFGGGVLAAYLYLRTGNLLVVVGLHALFNEPIQLIAAPVAAQWMLAPAVVAVIVWIETRGTRLTRAEVFRSAPEPES
jgi:membrane protease YdiL (CAAX protease family)